MEYIKAKKYIDKNIEALMELLGIGHWKLSISYERLEEKQLGECRSDARYENVLIIIDVEQIKDIEQLKFVLKHELMHILHSPFKLLWDAAKPYLPSDVAEQSLREVWHNAMELTVLNLERMHQGHMEETKKMKEKKGMGFKSAQNDIAKKEGVSEKSAGAILASSTRKASPKARRENPALNKVKGK